MCIYTRVIINTIITVIHELIIIDNKVSWIFVQTSTIWLPLVFLIIRSLHLLSGRHKKDLGIWIERGVSADLMITPGHRPQFNRQLKWPVYYIYLYICICHIYKCAWPSYNMCETSMIIRTRHMRETERRKLMYHNSSLLLLHGHANI